MSNVEEVVEPTGDEIIPKELAIRIAQSKALVMLSEDDSGVLTMQPMIPGGDYQPEVVKSHAYVDALLNEHPNIVNALNGNPTDAIRYRAIREYAVIGNEDEARFHKITEMLGRLNEEGDLPEEGKRKPADFDRYADFLALAIQETAPEPSRIYVPSKGVKLH
jgi:hypothetical protein